MLPAHLDALTHPPLGCAVTKAYDAIETADGFFKKKDASSDANHVFLRIPLVLHTTLNLEVFLDPYHRVEPDFLVVKPPGHRDNTPEGAKKAISAMESYDWVDSASQPLWETEQPAQSLTAFFQWLRQCWLDHQSSLFSEVIAASNERLQFEYASYLQGFGDDHAMYHVQRQEQRNVVTIGLPLFFGSDEQKKWRQLLFRVASTTMSFDTEGEKQALTERLEDWQRPAPIQIRYGCVLVLRDDSAQTFSVARETLQLYREGAEREEHSEVELLSGKREVVSMSLLYDALSDEIGQLLPVQANTLHQSLPKLAVDRSSQPTSFIDHIPNLEHELLDVWAAELYHWLDVVACLTGEFGTPLICSCGSVNPSGLSPRSATFAITDALSNLGCVLQVTYKNIHVVPEMTLTSTQHCLRNDGSPLRIGISLLGDDGVSKVLKVQNGKQLVDPVLLADETKAFLERVFPKFVQACQVHGKELVLV